MLRYPGIKIKSISTIGGIMIESLFQKNKTVFSLEVFPPKKEDDFPNAISTLDALALLNPDFISVTYGAGGSKSKKTVEIASYIVNTLKIPALAHLTCVGSKMKDIDLITKELHEHHITDILALRGDRPQFMSDEQFKSRHFAYAADLISYLFRKGDFTIAAACYPEKHFESPSLIEDLFHLKEKENVGAKFLISQLFFDNQNFYQFLDQIGKNNITLPVSAGIMPITSASQLGTTVSLSGSSVPKELSDLIAKYGDSPDDMRKAGIDFACRQIIDLIDHHVDGIHLYTMNKAKMAQEIMSVVR